MEGNWPQVGGHRYLSVLRNEEEHQKTSKERALFFGRATARIIRKKLMLDNGYETATQILESKAYKKSSKPFAGHKKRFHTL